MAGLFVAATGIFRFLGFAIGAGHGFGMKHTHGLFAGEYEAEAFTGLGGDVALSSQRLMSFSNSCFLAISEASSRLRPLSSARFRA